MTVSSVRIGKQLVAICSAAGLHSLTTAEARVHEVLVQSGLFEAGAVIVGTHAFLHIGNMLCVQWDRPAGWTDDVDSYQEQVISVASPPVEADIRETLLKAEKGVLAVPALDSRQTVHPVQCEKPGPDRLPDDAPARQACDSERPECGG